MRAAVNNSGANAVAIGGGERIAFAVAEKPRQYRPSGAVERGRYRVPVDCREAGGGFIQRQGRTQLLRIIKVGRVNFAAGEDRSAARKSHGLDTLDHQQ